MKSMMSEHGDSNIARMVPALTELSMYEKDDRCYHNPFLDCPDLTFNKVHVQQEIHTFVMKAMMMLEEVLRSPAKHYNVYSGHVGIAIALWKARREFLGTNATHSMPDIPEITSHHRLSTHGIGFCCDRLCYDLYQGLVQGEVVPVDPAWYRSTLAVNELLYGRAGLAVLLRYFHDKGVRFRSEDEVIHEVLSSIPMKDFPWFWYDKVYFGGAHGTAGILLTLTRIGKVKYPQEVSELISSAKLPSGNFKSSAESKSDRLVQWCHGATGVLPLLLEYEDCTDAKDAIDDAINLIWKRGLLTKGCGICHGVAGNAYAFLSAYKSTLREDYLQKAVVFAEIILAEGPDTCCRFSDAPYSLFNGLAGTMMFLIDLWKILELKGDEMALKEYQLFDGLQIF